MVAGGSLLAALAAAMNIHFIVKVGISVSHLTGDVSRLSADFALHQDITTEAGRLMLCIGGFVLGAVLSGYVIHHPGFLVARPYGRSVMFIGGVVLLGWAFESRVEGLAYVLIAGACGFQNALATRYRGIIIRTTHITGLMTDFGQLIGMRLAGRQVEGWKPLMHAFLAASFVMGSIAGAVLDSFCSRYALLVIGCIYVLVGLGWTIIKHTHMIELHSSVTGEETTK